MEKKLIFKKTEEYKIHSPPINSQIHHARFFSPPVGAGQIETSQRRRRRRLPIVKAANGRNKAPAAASVRPLLLL
jgi:hypothetical protein